ncbi:MAG: amidohydrolase [Clostridiales bacterium]|nr:amidohydrolase [Clostridiales bacterium]
MAGKACETGGGNAGEQALQAVAVKDGLIMAAGTDSDILGLAGPDTELVDLKGRCMLPGFNDSHCHLLATGITCESLDLRGVKSEEEIIQRGRSYIERLGLPEGHWVMGFGFDHNVFEGQRLPDGKVAEAVSSKHPVLLDRICGHVGVANRRAMENVGFTEETVIKGGIIGKNEAGELDGIIVEAALDELKRRIPKADVDETMRIIKASAALANSFGITSMQTDDLESSNIDVLYEAYSRLEREGKLTVRVYEEVQAARLPVLRSFLERGRRTGDGGSFFKTGCIKLLTDGSLGARTACLRSEYTDEPGNRGVAVYTQQELDEVVMEAHEAGMQIAFHAIGDGAAALCINAVEKAEKKCPKQLRHRIVHCQIACDGLLKMMKKLGMGADIQPPFTASDSHLVEERLGCERGRSTYRWKTMIDCGIPLGGGSDSPVETLDPLWGIYCAVTRKNADGKPAEGWYPEQCLTVEEATALYTKGGAYMSFEENLKGTIEPGKYADFAILSKDIFAIPPEEILATRVVMTVIGGSVCYTV